MKDRIEREIDEALTAIVNAPASPSPALMARVRAKAGAAKRGGGILAAACAALLMHAAAAFALAARAVASCGGGWSAVAAALAGTALALLPCVLLLAAGDIAGIHVKNRKTED